jgi:amino acid transporter
MEAQTAAGVPDERWYGAKRRLLGPPLATEELKNERLSKPLALGVLSSDGLSSAAYGTEQILYALIPFFGLAAFTLVLPMTLLVLLGVALVVLSYREVVSVYTRAGGSYVVARENFGPRVAQVAAVALLIDYVVTVAVQTAAGSAAIVSAFPGCPGCPWSARRSCWSSPWRRSPSCARATCAASARPGGRSRSRPTCSPAR